MDFEAHKVGLVTHYARMAWQGGDARLQAGWKAHFDERLEVLEQAHPGFTGAVRAEWRRLRDEAAPVQSQRPVDLLKRSA